MPYKQLEIPSGVPPRVTQFIRRLEDHYLCDVHCLLRLPLPQHSLTAGCNYAISQVLMAVIGGVSTTLYKQSGQSGTLFKDLLIDYYPWKDEPSPTVSPKDGADIIYSVFRNPLTHNLGFDVKKKSKTTDINLKRLTTTGGNEGLSDSLIAQIEDTKSRFNMSATVTIAGGATTLLVEALYWGVRVMLERLTKDNGRMQSAKNYLMSL